MLRAAGGTAAGVERARPAPWVGRDALSRDELDQRMPRIILRMGLAASSMTTPRTMVTAPMVPK